MSSYQEPVTHIRGQKWDEERNDPLPEGFVTTFCGDFAYEDHVTDDRGAYNCPMCAEILDQAAWERHEENRP